MRRKGSILVGLLWCLALLSVVVISVLHSSRLDLMVQKNYGDRIQARYLALAGIEKAKALLYQDALARRKAGKNHTGELYDDPEDFKAVAFGAGQFTVFRKGREDEGGGLIYGIADEESRLNINYAEADELAKLEGISPDIIAAIMDWRDDDNNVSPGGAEAEYYLGLRSPTLPRNGLLQTTRELLMVRGVTPDLLFGDAQGGDQLPALEAEPGQDAAEAGPENLNAGWSDVITVDGWVQNMNASGDKRINAQNADEKTLQSVHGITAEIARAIVYSRQQNKFESLADLLDVAADPNAGRGSRNPTPTRQPNAGPKLINEDLLAQVADELCVDGTAEAPGLLNINTASKEALLCLRGMTPELAQEVITYRRANGFFDNIAGVLKVPGLSRDIFKQFAKRITARSETFRIVSEGKVKSTGVRQRIQAIVHLGQDQTSIISYREDL